MTATSNATLVLLDRLGLGLPALIDLPSFEARMLLALRISVPLRQQGHDAIAEVTHYLGSPARSHRFLLMVEVLAAAWPEPFRIARPCCPVATFDESTMVNLLRLGAVGNRPAFDQIIADMIAGDARERLYDAMVAFYRVVRG